MIVTSLETALVEAKNLIAELDTTKARLTTAQADIETLSTTLAIMPRLFRVEQAIGAAFAYMHINVPYKFGAEWETEGKFDCSSFVQACCRRAGISLPRTSHEQSRFGVKLAGDERGALLCYDRTKNGVMDHVLMSLGNGQAIHTAKIGENINICNWKERYGEPNVIVRWA